MYPRGDFSLKYHVGLTYANYTGQVMGWKSLLLTKIGYYFVAYSLPKSNNFFLTNKNYNGFSCI